MNWTDSEFWQNFEELPMGWLSNKTPGTKDNCLSDKSGGGVPFGTASSWK